MFFFKILPQRTNFGSKYYGRIKGFVRFLEIAEKTQLEKLVNDNPEYFYDILPYTYALGVSNVWASKFESIIFNEPSWYVTVTGFDFSAEKFDSYLSRTMDSVTEAMTSSYDSINDNSSNYNDSSCSSRDSSSSGGGSAGHGSGGGGGSSW